MADFCKECSLEMFDKDFEELAGLSTKEDTENDLFPCVLCEGCGFIQVDHTGKCISKNCLSNHKRSRSLTYSGDDLPLCGMCGCSAMDQDHD